MSADRFFALVCCAALALVIRGFNLSYYDARQHSLEPSPRCCFGADCVTHSGRFAVVTPFTSDEYIPLLEELACSLRRSNPGIPLYAMTARDILSNTTLSVASKYATVMFVKSLFYHNNFPRYTKNWIKLRAWGLTQFDGLLLVDSDVSIVGNLTSVFSLPTDFAVSFDEAVQGKAPTKSWNLGYNQAGVVFLRPCLPVANHMMHLVAKDPALRFSSGHAEQDFLNWYFSLTRVSLPLEFNGVAHILSNEFRSTGGVPAKVVHHTEHKPFQKRDDIWAHSILCSKTSNATN